MAKDNISSKRNLEKNTSFAKNVMMLAAAQIVVKILGLVYKIIIVNVPGFGDTGNGYYSAGYQLYMVLLALSSIGIPTVISKLVSERVAVGDYKSAYKVFKVSFNLFTAIGFVLAAIMFIFAKSISIALFSAEGVSYTLMALAPAVMFVSSNSVLRGYFTGLGSLKSTSISEIVEQTFNCILSILFVYMAVGKDTAIMAAAGNLSTTIAAFISMGYMISHYFLRRKYLKLEMAEQTAETENTKTWSLIKIIILLALPSAFASLISTLSSNIDSITVNQATGDVGAFGLLSKTETLTHLPLALSATLYVAIVPVIAALIKTGDNEGATNKLSSTLFLSNIIIFPCAFGFIALAGPILALLYPTAPDGAFLLQLQTIAMIFSAFTYVLNGVFYGLGKQKYPAIILFIGTSLKLGLNILFLYVFKMSVVSAVVSTIIYQALVTVLEMIVLNKFVKIKFQYKKQIIKPFMASLIMGICAFLAHKLLVGFIGNSISTIIAIFVGIIVYGIGLLALKMLEKEDVLMLPKGELIYSLMLKFKLIK